MFRHAYDAESQVPTFDTIEDFEAVLADKELYKPAGLYPRDGSKILGQTERKAANLAGIQPERLLAYNSGMSAVTDAIDVALHEATSDHPTVLCAQELYSQTAVYLNKYIRGKRAKVVPFDNGDKDYTLGQVKKYRPDVIVAETVTNNIQTAVLPTRELLRYVRRFKDRPTLILDNTLPLSTGLPLASLTGETDRVIVTESGTKAYNLNGALAGWNYTHNEDLRLALLELRRTRGSIPDPSHLHEMVRLMMSDRTEFDARNRKIFASTGALAVRLDADLGSSPRVFASHPAIPTHDNHDRYSNEYPDGGAPVSFVYSSVIPSIDLARKLWHSPAVRAQAEIGPSFGFDTARILINPRFNAIRIAGGAETDGEALGAACAEAFADC